MVSTVLAVVFISRNKLFQCTGIVYFLSNLSGLWFGQVLSLHLSGIVLVPSPAHTLTLLRWQEKVQVIFIVLRCKFNISTSLSRLNKQKSKCVHGLRDYFFALTLSGRCIGQFLSLQRSGMVFVPCIMRDLHMGHFLPVGFALMAYLQSGYSLQL